MNPHRRLLLHALSGLTVLPWASVLANPAELSRLSARHAFIGNMNDTLLAINADQTAPIASLTKLITASVIFSTDLPLEEPIRIMPEDAMRSEFTASHLPVGSIWRRAQLLEWLLVASDNRAAEALARSFPGGWPEFQYSMRILTTQMQLFSFDFVDPSGLSPLNRANARDIGVLLSFLALQPRFQALSRQQRVGQKLNINRFAHDPGIVLMTGKTGHTASAGYCLAEAEQFNQQIFAMVVLNSAGREQRARDMNLLRSYTQHHMRNSTR